MDYIFRGFHPDENGTQEIWTDGTCNGEKVTGRIKGEWIEGYSFKSWDKCYILWGTTNDIPNMIEVIPETVGLNVYDVLIDGIKIYTGDLFKWENKTFEVIYCLGSFMLKSLDFEMYDVYSLFAKSITDIKYIGTIFDKEADNG